MAQTAEAGGGPRPVKTVVYSMVSSGSCDPEHLAQSARGIWSLHLLNRFVRWRRAGVWNRLIDALAAAHDATIQMIDASIVRAHQHGACIIRNRRQSTERSRGG
jgi:transposase